MLKKIKEFTKEELKEQLENGEIDYEFLIDYTIKRDKAYNKLIDKTKALYEENKQIKEYIIKNIGCHDETVTKMELTEKELEVLKKFAILNNENSGFSCQPTINILINGEYIVNSYGESDE